MTASDGTTALGTVPSAVPGSTSITLSANSLSAVAIGDTLNFALKNAKLADHVTRAVAGYTAQWSGS